MMNRRDRVTSFGARPTLRFAILACALALAPLSAQAKTGRPHPALASIQETLKQCEGSDPSTAAQNSCLDDAIKAADAVLNRVYMQIVARLKKGNTQENDAEIRRQDDQADAEILKRLIASQRAWVTYRKADCAHEGTGMLGGSGEGIIVAVCEFEMRVDRVNNLFEDYRIRFPEIAGKR